MKFCETHWTAMRKAVDDRAMTHLVARDGKEATSRLEGELAHEPEADTFDPLMSMHWAIAGNVNEMLMHAHMNPLYLMASENTPEDLLDTTQYGPQYAGRTWPRCPLCYLNLAHEVSCTDRNCTLSKAKGYDWMIARSADDAAERARVLHLMPEPS